MELSIITPIFNGGKFVAPLCRNVLSQSIEDWELLLIDDGSTDDTGLICDTFAAENPSHIRVIHKTNGGVSTARNLGLEEARGKYIGFIDCDDGIYPDMFRKLIEKAESEKCDLVMGGYEKVSDDGTKNPVFLPFHDDLPEDAAGSTAYSMAFWDGYYKGKKQAMLYGSVWPNLYRADIIRENNIRFPVGITIGEDTIFNITYLSFAKKIGVVNEPLYMYNVSSSSATRKQNKKLWERYKDLLGKSVDTLTERFGNSEDLEYNRHKQAINFAVSYAEEQLCVFYSGKELKSKLKELCSDPLLHESSGFILKHGKEKKEKIQAFLWYNKLLSAITFWLNH
ncbi:MAG: glycosyltransferase [Clostridia bacterium]|nr:glycosyltransferase [Clostridia bacterium]